jgi:hypothetical protein
MSSGVAIALSPPGRRPRLVLTPSGGTQVSVAPRLRNQGVAHRYRCGQHPGPVAAAPGRCRNQRTLGRRRRAGSPQCRLRGEAPCTESRLPSFPVERSCSGAGAGGRTTVSQSACAQRTTVSARLRGDLSCPKSACLGRMAECWCARGGLQSDVVGFGQAAGRAQCGRCAQPGVVRAVLAAVSAVRKRYHAAIPVVRSGTARRSSL